MDGVEVSLKLAAGDGQLRKRRRTDVSDGGQPNKYRRCLFHRWKEAAADV